MISVAQALRIHAIAIESFGGADGVRDMGSLESALARPFQAFSGEELYPTIFEKAAAICESIIVNHLFVDGNKRTGYILMEALLRHEGYAINASDEVLYSFVIKISTGTIPFDEIVAWLKEFTTEE